MLHPDIHAYRKQSLLGYRYTILISRENHLDIT